METMIRNTKRTLLIIFAIVFFIVGVAGLILPIIPGLLFLAVAVALLSVFSPTIQELLHSHTRKVPKLHTIVLKVDEYVRRIIGEI